MRRAPTLSLLLCLLAASTASAHDTVPKTWCPTGTQLVVIRQFSFSERQLIEYRNQRLADGSVLGSTCNTLKTCGIIDEWYWANQMAHEYAMGSLLRKVKLEVAVNDSFVKPAVDAILEGARTGKVGDGKIFVLDLPECIRIRTGETGSVAIG